MMQNHHDILPKGRFRTQSVPILSTCPDLVVSEPVQTCPRHVQEVKSSLHGSSFIVFRKLCLPFFQGKYVSILENFSFSQRTEDKSLLNDLSFLVSFSRYDCFLLSSFVVEANSYFVCQNVCFKYTRRKVLT